MKTLFTTLVLFLAHTTFAASLHCNVYDGETQEISTQKHPLIGADEAPKAGLYVYFKIATLSGLDVLAEVSMAPGLSEQVQLFTNMNGVRVYTGVRALLTNDNKEVIDARCEIQNPTPYAPVQILPGPTIP